MRRVIYCLIFFTFVHVSYSQDEKAFFRYGFELHQVTEIQKHELCFQDTIPDDTLHTCIDQTGLPVAHFRRINTGVCYEGVCVPVDIQLFWTISGEYLGYFLKDRRILTKNQDHEPFTWEDYQRLHVFLQDQQSLLKTYSISEITSDRKTSAEMELQGLDGSTGATIADIRGYIVTGAAYTTYTLWHYVHAETRDSIMYGFNEYVSEELLSRMLQSANVSDKRWAVRKLSALNSEVSLLFPLVEKILISDPYYLKEEIVHFLFNLDENAEDLQGILFRAYNKGDLGTKRLLIRNWTEQDMPINNEIAKGFIESLPDENAIGIHLIFKLLKSTYVPDSEDIELIKLYTGSTNNELADASREYLISLSGEVK